MFKALDLWLPSWLARDRSQRWRTGEVRHVILAVCDHFEPLHGTDRAGALERIATWRREWPPNLGEFRGAGGIGPRHTFFYPAEQYDPEIFRALADLAHEIGGEIEVHLHHEDDTAENLHATLLRAKELFASHGALARDAVGEIRYAFIHGNWALDHSHPTGRHCGVANELALLRESGCYADFTLPSAPHRTQTRKINSLYYAREDGRPKSHDGGERVRAGVPGLASELDRLLIVQGPLALNWRRRKLGLLPRIENSDLTAANPPTIDRFRLWFECAVSVENRPDWVFIKLHTHGAKPENTAMLLGEPMRSFHRALDALALGDPTLHIHYVTARELVNVVHAAEAGFDGDPESYRDFVFHRD